MRTYRVAAIPGDGIGKEVVAAGIEVLEACGKREGGFAPRRGGGSVAGTLAASTRHLSP